MQESKYNKILVTGGAGYIGSHTVVELLNAGYVPIIIDNFSNSKPTVCERIATITGHKPIFIKADCRDKVILRSIFADYHINAVIHFAGFKAVGESIKEPILYYDNNIRSSIALLEVMADFGVKKIVFSSSAIVYGDPPTIPIKESFPKLPSNPYGRTKLIIEQMLCDLHAADPEWQIVILRYFNPVGAHPSGLIGEDPVGIPNNLMPYISQVAAGKLNCLNIFGNDYDTPDGTGIRDYIHVVDLAFAHLKALEVINSISLAVYNIGAGRGYSVLEMVHAFEKYTGRKIPYRIVARRPGDIAVCYADTSLAARELHWWAYRKIDTICRDTWCWQSQNKDF